MIQLWRIVEGFVTKTRRFMIFKQWSVLRTLQLLSAAAIFAVVIWSMNQSYLVVLPIVSAWLYTAGVITALILLLSVVVPRTKSE